VKYDIGGDLAANGAIQRKFRAEMLRGTLFSASEFAAITANDLSEQLEQGTVLASTTFVDRFAHQSQQFVSYLLQVYPQQLRECLRGTAWKAESGDRFHHCFGVTLDDALSGWKEWEIKRELPPYETAPQSMKSLMEEKLIAPILARDTAADHRLACIRGMGSLGYLWRVDVLVDLLANEDAAVRSWSLHSLENLAGELVGEDADAWEHWIAALPRELSGRPDMTRESATFAENGLRLEKLD
jgi:hypothetical protein